MRELRYTAAALLLGLVWMCSIGRPSTKRPHFTDIAARSRFTYRTNNNFTGRKYFHAADVRRRRDPGLRPGWQDGHLLHQRRQIPGDEEDGSVLLQLPAAQQRRRNFRRRDPFVGLKRRRLGLQLRSCCGGLRQRRLPESVVCGAGRNTLYHNNRDGTFSDVTESSGIGGKPPDTLSVDAAWFDYDNDGLPDLFVSNCTLWTPQTDIRCAAEDGERYSTRAAM